MENLTKQQIVLVTLLVSFVTSIATGIVTVSLMDQAPPGMTQTINRVVERTIEKVVQAPSQAAVVTKETVVVKEDDLVVAAIEENTPHIVRVIDSEGGVAALGLIISNEGIIAVDSWRLLPDVGYSVQFSSGTTSPAARVYQKGLYLTLLKAALPKGEGGEAPSAAKFADSDKIKLGQSVVYIGGRQSNNVETGLISNVTYEELKEESDAATTTTETRPQAKVVAGLSSSVGSESAAGGILTNLSSEVIAFAVMRDGVHFVPSNDIVMLHKTYTASLEGSKSATSTTP